MNSNGAILLDPDGSIHVPLKDAPVTEKHRRIDELLRGYDPYLELHFIPPESRGPLDTKPWAVIHRPPHGKPYYVGFFDDADERLLAHIISIDNTQGSVLNRVDAYNKAVEALRLKEQQEARIEAGLIAASVLRSPKIHYKHDGVDFSELRGRKDSR
jgi:hypothetical protein